MLLLETKNNKCKNLLSCKNKTFVFSTWIFKCIHFNIQFSNISTPELLELITCIIEFFYIVFPHIHFIKYYLLAQSHVTKASQIGRVHDGDRSLGSLPSGGGVVYWVYPASDYNCWWMEALSRVSAITRPFTLLGYLQSRRGNNGVFLRWLLISTNANKNVFSYL